MAVQGPEGNLQRSSHGLTPKMLPNMDGPEELYKALEGLIRPPKVLKGLGRPLRAL